MTAPQLYRTYFEDMPCCAAIQDRELRLVETNRMFRKLFGEPGERHCWQVCKQRVSLCPDCPVDAVFRTGQPQSAQEVLRSPRGDELPIMVYASPIRTHGADVTHVLEVFADISEVRRLQARLHRAEHRFRHLFDDAPCYITVQDRHLNLISVNRRFREDFGDEPGLRCYEAYKHRDEPCLECPVVRTFEEGTPQTSEEVVTSIGGRQCNVLVNTAPIRSSDGEITEVMEMSTNITEVRALESQLTSLGLLIGSISHGVKGLLTAIDGGAYLVNSGIKRGDQQRVHGGWDIVQRNMRRIRSMMLDILYYSRDRELEYDEVDVLETAAEISGIVAYRAEETDIEFERQFSTSAGRFETDPGALQTALVNILENAFDACRMDRKKPHHQVTFAAREDGPDHVLFEVSDNGIGMDRETAEKAFTLFFSSKGSEGTGLGLFISNKTVRQLGGQMDLDSIPGQGSRFRIRLPRRRAQPEP